jgi:hypothetical protein
MSGRGIPKKRKEKKITGKNRCQKKGMKFIDDMG